MASVPEIRPDTSRVDSTERALELVGLLKLMRRTRGRPEVRIGLIDGPVAIDHDDFGAQAFDYAPGAPRALCVQRAGNSCEHGTFIAGILSANRQALAPGICADCTLVLHPVLTQPALPSTGPMTASASTVANAVINCVEAGVHVINLSVAEVHPPFVDDPHLGAALDYAAQHGVLVVAAAGNQGAVSGSSIVRHPWVIPVLPCTIDGLPLTQSNLGGSIARRGLMAPGIGIVGTTVGSQPAHMAGSSIAAPLVTGTIGLLLSQLPRVPAGEIRFAVAAGLGKRRKTLIPPLLDAWSTFQYLAALYPGEVVAR